MLFGIPFPRMPGTRLTAELILRITMLLLREISLNTQLLEILRELALEHRLIIDPIQNQS
jgi:hypothetical protein